MGMYYEALLLLNGHLRKMRRKLAQAESKANVTHMELEHLERKIRMLEYIIDLVTQGGKSDGRAD